MKEFWNDRYSKPGFAYGREPNSFFKEEIDNLRPGKILLLGEGEGRNGIYSAKLGWDVTGVDFSEAAMKKALDFAGEENVKMNYILSDLKDYNPDPDSFDAAAIIFLHLEQQFRIEVHRKVVSALKTGGRLIFECYEKDNLETNSGGPKDPNLLYSLEDIVTDFQDFDILAFEKKNIPMNEGNYHKGTSVVIRFAGIKE